MAEPERRLLLLNGPNLNMLGRRDPKIYGTFTLADAEDLARRTAAAHGFGLDSFQSNHEGSLVDRIQEAIGRYAGVLINAGALTHYSYALRDALELLPVPVIEVHISDISQREDFRRLSVIRPVCRAQVAGFGLDSYRIAIEEIVRLLQTNEGDGAGSGGESGMPNSTDSRLKRDAEKGGRP